MISIHYFEYYEDDYYGTMPYESAVEEIGELSGEELDKYLESDECFNLSYKKKSFDWDYAEIQNDDTGEILHTFYPRTWHDDIYDELEILYLQGLGKNYANKKRND